MKTLLLVLLTLINLGVAGDSAADENPKDSNSYYIPKTVSQEAATFIQQFKKSWRDKHWPDPDDIKAWEVRKEEYETAVLPNNQKLTALFEPTIEERVIEGVKVLDVRPKDWEPSDKIVVYLHGGAYTLFSAHSSLNNVLPLADTSKYRFIVVDYMTAPVSRWKKTTTNVMSVIENIYSNHGAENTALMGDSAGGGLAAGLVHKLVDNDFPMPAAILLWSPWSDITRTGDTYYTLRDAELHYSYPALLQHSANAYADPEDQNHPYVSPVYGEFTDTYPPTLIQGGTKELFLSNFVRLYQKIESVSENGAKLDLYEGMWHVFQGNHEIPESKIAIEKSAKFLKQYLD